MESHQFRNEQEEPPASSRKLTRSQRELSHIRHWFDGGACTIRTLFIQTARQGSKAFRLEHLAHGSRAEGRLTLLQSFADLIDRIVLFPQSDDQIASR